MSLSVLLCVALGILNKHKHKHNAQRLVFRTRATARSSYLLISDSQWLMISTMTWAIVNAKASKMRAENALNVMSTMLNVHTHSETLNTYSEILLPNSRLAGLELAEKMIRPPLVAFMSSCFPVTASTDSGSGSLGTQALLSPSCQHRTR